LGGTPEAGGPADAKIYKEEKAEGGVTRGSRGNREGKIDKLGTRENAAGWRNESLNSRGVWKKKARTGKGLGSTTQWREKRGEAPWGYISTKKDYCHGKNVWTTWRWWDEGEDRREHEGSYETSKAVHQGTGNQHFVSVERAGNKTRGEDTRAELKNP